MSYFFFYLKEIGLECVKSWYNENQAYNFKRPHFSPNSGHFTQLIWKDSRKLALGLGVGKKNSFNAFYCVAQYQPAGNINSPSYFKANVLPPKWIK